MREKYIQELLDQEIEKPTVVKWFNVWCWIQVVCGGIVMVWAFKDAFCPSELVIQRHPRESHSMFYTFNAMLGFVMVVYVALHAYPVLRKPRPSSYLVGVIIFVLLLLQLPVGTLIGLAFLHHWRSMETKEYYCSEHTHAGDA